ncbi:MAG: ribosome-associated translation inhibitor RaiA [Clostridia bacterium]|nr:ribosome-associated translation inhibitor RaiA [Clostridia bacterium]
MIVTIIGKSMEITDYLKELTLKKLEKLEKYFPQDTEAQVVMSVEKSRHSIEITIPYRGGIIRGEETTTDMYASIDNVIAKLDRQILKHKTKLSKNLRYEEEAAAEEYDDDYESNGPEIVKVKRFSMKPMSVEEAMLQMDLLGHSFFVFTNGETGEINVLYSRKDGNYGLIEPDR